MVTGGVEIEFDPAKDAANRAKHGVSLAAALFVLETRVGEIVDDRRDYGEARMNAFGFIRGRLFVCTYTVRREVYRVISLRRASRQERLRWQRCE